MPIYTNYPSNEDVERNMGVRKALDEAGWMPGEKIRAMGGYKDPSGTEHYESAPEEMIGRAMQNVLQTKEQALREKMGQGAPRAEQQAPQEQPEDILALVTRKIAEQPPRYQRPKGAVEVPGFEHTKIYQKPDPKDPKKVIYSNVGSSEMLSGGQQAWTNVLLHIVDAMKKSKSADVTAQQKATAVLNITKLYYQQYKDVEEKDRPPVELFIQQQMAIMYPNLLNPQGTPSMDFPTAGEPQYPQKPIMPTTGKSAIPPGPQRNVPVVGTEQMTLGSPDYKRITESGAPVRKPIPGGVASAIPGGVTQGKTAINTGTDTATGRKVIVYSDGSTKEVGGQSAVKQARPSAKSPAKRVAPKAVTAAIDLSGAGAELTGGVPLDKTLKDITKAIESLKVSDDTKEKIKKLIYKSMKKGQTISPSYQGL